MNLLLALLIAILYGVGTYLMLRRSIVKLLFGLMLLGNATNLLLFSSGRLVRGKAPIAPEGATQPAYGSADPLAQALILTAIVISFAVLGFALVLVKRTYVSLGDDDLDQLDGGRP